MATYAYETPRLYLEKLTVEDHLEDFHELWNNADALIWSTQPPKKNLIESQEWMQSQLPSLENPDIDKYAILLKPIEENPKPWVNGKGKPKMIGMTGTNRYSDEGMETGYCLNIAYWGRGYAGEAFRGFLECFWNLDERRAVEQLVAKVDAENIASQKIVKRLGAQYGGVLKEWYSRRVDNGVKRDIEYWLIDRPGASEEEVGAWKEEVKRQVVRKKELERAKEERERTEKDEAEAETKKELKDDESI